MEEQEDCPQASWFQKSVNTHTSGVDAPVMEETKYQEDVLVEKEIKCEEGAAAKEELE